MLLFVVFLLGRLGQRKCGLKIAIASETHAVTHVDGFLG
ncbi:ORFL173W [Human betaherpesvirus 5]|nr:ORFL173W [Human betaherpesvirus 5]QHX40517.1 ORFL173W [Human betaherpesvirus 5]